MNYKILILVALVASVLLSGCIDNKQSEAKATSVPKYYVGDSITSVYNVLLGGNITKISDGNYILDNNMRVNITDADSGKWSNTIKKYVPKFSIGDHVVPNGAVGQRYIIREVDLDSGRYVVSYVQNNVTSSDVISTVDGYSKINKSYPAFKVGDYIYSTSTLEYAKILNISNETELYSTTKGGIDFMDTTYHKLDPHNPPNGLYLYKDSTTGLRFIYNEFDNRGYFVIMNMKSGEITKVEQITRVVYHDSSSSNNGHSDADVLGAAVIGFALGISI